MLPTDSLPSCTARAAPASRAPSRSRSLTAATSATAHDDAGYFGFADRVQQQLDPIWDDDAGYYRGGPG
ncbi:hypothetical protein Q0L78_13920, partial [Staphylococcus aureus]|nr:hypothetical protein [Staphylococcus aureus]